MAPTEGRVAKPERRWGCRRGVWQQKEDSWMNAVRHGPTEISVFEVGSLLLKAVWPLRAAVSRQYISDGDLAAAWPAVLFLAHIIIVINIIISSSSSSRPSPKTAGRSAVCLANNTASLSPLYCLSSRYHRVYAQRSSADQPQGAALSSRSLPLDGILCYYFPNYEPKQHNATTKTN